MKVGDSSYTAPYLPILIFHEPTASIDTGTEAATMDTLKHVVPRRTTFVTGYPLR